MPDRLAGAEWLFFDLGGTLFDATAAVRGRAEAFVPHLAQLGIKVSAAQMVTAVYETATRFAPAPMVDAMVALSVGQLDTGQVRDAAPYDHALEKVRDGAREVVARLAKSYRLGVLANQKPGGAERLQQRGLASYFELCLCSAELGMAKPDPAIFERALQQASCPPEKAVMIGDRIDNDIRPARAAGWQTMRLRAGYFAGQQPRDEADRADVTVTSLRELLALL